VFIRPSDLLRPDGLLTDLGCGTDDAGFATVDGTGRTTRSPGHGQLDGGQPVGFDDEPGDLASDDLEAVGQ
jgi:hypothetical protein